MTLTRNLCINKNTTGAERGNTQEQGFGALAEIVIRNKLDMSEYLSSDSLPREAKHNLFARQVYNENLDTDIYKDPVILLSRSLLDFSVCQGRRRDRHLNSILEVGRR